MYGGRSGRVKSEDSVTPSTKRSTEFHQILYKPWNIRDPINTINNSIVGDKKLLPYTAIYALGRQVGRLCFLDKMLTYQLIIKNPKISQHYAASFYCYPVKVRSIVGT
ncbi:hypothetical protein ACVIGV_004251 [Rhizobium leguminosarum]